MNSEQEEHARLMNRIATLESDKTFLLVDRHELLRALRDIRDGHYNGKIGGALSDIEMADIASNAIKKAEGEY